MIKYTVKVFSDGSRHWWLNGQRHREDGPASEYADGGKEWFLNGELHREDGPAVEYENGIKEWWLNDKQMTEEEHAKATSKVEEMTMEEVCEALGKNIKIKK